MPYIYTLRRGVQRAAPKRVAPPPAPVPEPVETSYRDLQAQAKELGISAKQTRAELEAAIAEANDA